MAELNPNLKILLKGLDPKFEPKEEPTQEPIVPAQKVNIKPSILTGKEAEDFLEEYNKLVEKDYNGNINLKKYSINEQGELQGSSTLSIPLINKLGFRTIKQNELEEFITTTEGLSLVDGGHCVDTGIVIINKQNTFLNSYLAMDLSEQLRQRNYSMQFPVYINLTDLEIINDPESSYKLAFKLKKDVEILYAPILDSADGKFSFQDIDKPTGLPNKLCGKGTRTFSTGKSGLSGFCLGAVLGLYFGHPDLAYSSSNGRVIIVAKKI